MKQTEDTRKITAHLPTDLLNEAMKQTGLGITETLKAGLAELRRAKAYETISQLRGKVKFSKTYKQLREDRE